MSKIFSCKKFREAVEIIKYARVADVYEGERLNGKYHGVGKML
jgi:hypothetical protein